MAVGSLSAREVHWPHGIFIAGEILLFHIFHRLVQAPAVGANDLDSLVQHPEQSVFGDAGVEGIVVLIGQVLVAPQTHDAGNISRLQGVADPGQFILQVLHIDDVLGPLVPEVQHHPVSIAPLQGYVINGHGRLALTNSTVVPGRVQMGACMGQDGQGLGIQCLPIRKGGGLHPRRPRVVSGVVLVIAVLDLCRSWVIAIVCDGDTQVVHPCHQNHSFAHSLNLQYYIRLSRDI